jgi:HEPN domain-containing protein
MADRSGDWLAQAERDLEMARHAREAGHHEWACFGAHQCAEKALKAVHLRASQEMRGHALVKLIQNLPPEIVPPADLVERARVLDGYYIPTRYPDGYSEGAPFEYFGAPQSDQAIEHAGEILRFSRAAMAQAR